MPVFTAVRSGRFSGEDAPKPGEARPVVAKDIRNDRARLRRGQAPALDAIPGRQFWRPNLSAAREAGVGSRELKKAHRSISQDETRTEFVE